MYIYIYICKSHSPPSLAACFIKLPHFLHRRQDVIIKLEILIFVLLGKINVWMTFETPAIYLSLLLRLMILTLERYGLITNESSMNLLHIQSTHGFCADKRIKYCGKLPGTQIIITYTSLHTSHIMTLETGYVLNVRGRESRSGFTRGS